MSDDLYDGPCESGCVRFHGGELRHHRDCGHYPHSLTKVNADRIEELKTKLTKAVEALEHAKLNMPHPDQMIDNTLAELKGDKP